MSAKCVDLSRYQAGFDFRAFKAGGGLAVICKASEGSTIADSSYQTFRVQALDVGLAFASYHFLRPGDMEEQARFYLRTAGPVHGERVVADYEDANVSLADLIAFLQEIHAVRPGLQLTVYGSNVLEETIGSQRVDWLAKHTSLWTAAYSSSPGKYPTQVWPHWSLWQYTDNETVAGFDGPVDGDAFNGSDENLVKWIGPAAPAPTPPTLPTATIVISSDRPVRVRLGPNIEVVS